MTQPSILIVEDNNIVMLELKERLLEMKYTVADTASSGQEAIDKAYLHKPNLVMMDIRLKGEMDGIDAAAKIHKGLDIPIVYLTAHTDDNTIERAKLTAPYGYIVKPFEERELHTTIEMALYKYSMEKKLKESEHWLSATLKSIGDALIATDASGTIKLINHVGEELTGWEYKEALGKDINEVFKVKDIDTGEILEDPVYLSLKEGAIIGETNKIIISKDGKETPVDFSAAPIEYGNEKHVGVVLVFRDITERIKAKETIEKQHIFLRTIIDTDPNFISVKNSDGKFKLANKATTEALGTDTEKILEKFDKEYDKNINVNEVKKTDNQALDTLEEVFIPEETLIDAKGKVHLLQTFKRAIDSYNGKEKLVLSVGSDITPLLQKERELKESEKRINTLLKAIPDIVLRFSNDGILIDYHIQGFNVLNAEVENLIGENIFNMFEPALAEKILTISREAFNTNQVQIFEHDYINKSETIYVEIRIVNNLQNEFIAIIKDITGRKKSQLELKELNASKDKFFSIIAHDLKSPFNSLIGLTGFLTSEINDLSKDEIKSISENISSSSKSIFSLLENLLQWSRIRTGRMEFAPQEIQLKEIIEKTVALHIHNAENKNISLHTELKPVPEVFADANMIETILRNLISNAIKFTRPSGKINITAVEKGNNVEVYIRDNGVGIKKEAMDKLFKIDENVSTYGTQNEQGSGLGLILCKEFIELNKGKLTVNSKEGEGSTFSFTLPKDDIRK